MNKNVPERRLVNVYKMVAGGKRKFVGVGTFHQFGIDYEEFDSGPGQFTTAIVEMEDGSVKNVYVDLITFRIPKEA